LTSVFAEEGNGLLHRLKGTYQFIGAENCSEVPIPIGSDDPGFSPAPEFRVLGLPWALGLTISYNVQTEGTITFDGAGNATSDLTWANILPGLLEITGPQQRMPPAPFDQPFGSGSTSCDWTYSVSADNRFAMEGNCVSNIVDGVAAGTRDEVGPFQLRGFISLGGNVLIGASTTPSTEISESGGQMIIRYFDGNEVYRAKRLCTMGSTYVRANKKAARGGDTED